MIIQSIAKMLDIQNENVKRGAKALDWITGVALTIIGGLVAGGVLPMSSLIGGALLGAGIVYTILMLLTVDCKMSSKVQAT